MVKSVVKRAVWTLVALALSAAVAVPRLLHVQEAGVSSGGSAKSRTPEPALKVTAVTVQAVPFSETLTSTGTLRAEEAVELQAETAGKVVAINFREGVRVKEGDLLLKINDADLRASHARAKHRKHLAELRERRFAALVGQGVIRQEDYDIALNELNVQNAEIALIEAQIAKTEIRAPFSGVVGLRYVSEGAFVNATTRVATLQRLDTLKVDFSVPEKYAGRVRAGSPITLAVAGSQQRFSGEIYAFDPRIDVATRTVLIRAFCPNPDGRLLPGAFAHVELALAQIDDAVLVPTVALIPGLNEKHMFVVSEGKAQLRVVQTGTRTESYVHVLSGLQPGDVVVTSGLQQLREGLAVVADRNLVTTQAATHQ